MWGDKATVPHLTDTATGQARTWYLKRLASPATAYPCHLGSFEDRVSFWCAACVAAEPHQDYAYQEFVKRETRWMAAYWLRQSTDQWQAALPDTCPVVFEERKERGTEDGGTVMGVFAVVPFEQCSWLWAGTTGQDSFPASILPPIAKHGPLPRDVRDEVQLRRGQCYVPQSLLHYVLVEGYVRFLKSNRAVFQRRRQLWIEGPTPVGVAGTTLGTVGTPAGTPAGPPAGPLPWLADIKAPLSPMEQLHVKYQARRDPGCAKPIELTGIRKPPCIVSMERKLSIPQHLQYTERESYVAYLAGLAHPSRVLPYVADHWRDALRHQHGNQQWEPQWKLLEADVKALAQKVHLRKRTYGCNAMIKCGHCVWREAPATIATRLQHDPQLPAHRLTTIRPKLLNAKVPPQIRCGQLLQAYQVQDQTSIKAPWEFSIRE